MGRGGDRVNDEELRAGAAHDIANALSAVVGWVELARSGANVDHALEAIEAAARAARTTAQVLLGDVEDEAPADLATTAQAVGRLLAPEARERGVQVQVRTASAVHTPLGSAGAFRCLWNLGLNAVQNARTRVEIIVGPGSTFSVEDDGIGMDEETQHLLLTKGFTTREGGHGLGVGIVRRLVEGAGGALALESEVGRGTTFSGTLPRVAAPRPKAVSGVQRRALARRVLVVEDDEGVREMVVTALDLRGIDAIGVGSLAEVAALDDNPFDVAMVDLTLGDASGVEVIRHLRARKLSRRIILASGASEPYLPPDAQPDNWLRKPFDVGQLLDVLAPPIGKEATG